MSLRKIISLCFTLIFVFFAVVQYNDPDPQFWIPIYLIVAVACLVVFFEKAPNQYVYWVVAVAYLFLAFKQWPPQYEGILFGEMQMRSINIELARESLGLAICSVGLCIMAYITKKA